MIRERIDAHHITVALSHDDAHLIACALESYQVSLLALDPDKAVASLERAAHCETLSTALGIAADLMERGGDGRPD
jgi:hypothetical protein